MIGKDLGRVCFILGGGGAKGSVEVGQFKALAENGIVPEFIIGVSVGALNAAKLVEKGASGTKEEFLKANEELENIWLNHISSRKQIYVYNLMKIARLKSLFDPAPLKNLISGLDYETIVNSPIRFDVAVSKTTSAKEVIFSNKDVPKSIRMKHENAEKVILASTAIPGLFPVVEIEGEKYFDGAMTAPLPIYIAARDDYDAIFILSTNPPPNKTQPEKIIRNWRDGLLMGAEASRDKLQMMELNWTRNVNKNLRVLEALRDSILNSVPENRKEAVAKVFDEHAQAFRFIQKRQVKIFYLYSDKLPKTLTALSFKRSDIQAAIEEGYKSTLRQLKELELI